MDKGGAKAERGYPDPTRGRKSDNCSVGAGLNPEE